MTLSDTDRILLERCLDRAPMAWEDFVDRFLPLVLQVVQHTSFHRGLRLDASRQEDLVADVFVALIHDDFHVLRRFRKECSFATYLTVIARRVVARRVARYIPESTGGDELAHQVTTDDGVALVENRDQLEHLLQRLDPNDALLLRCFHIQGLSYGEIHQRLGIPENSIGPSLHRARTSLRRLVEMG
ncbi:MAG: sigma-70 family RNA polymerase sigma factor [Planctomycetaceae bacterium]|nr:sigma-70 family RNA polymerase sigma factor [Planctomycetaceae bacterium]